MSRLTERELELIRRERLAAERDAGPQGGTGFFTTAIIEPIRQAMRRQRTYAELSQLDDRMLRDIGLHRSQLADLADHMAPRKVKSDKSAGLIGTLRQWRRRRETIAQLRALDDRSLADIGLVRGNIPFVVDNAMAAEKTRKTQSKGVDQLVRRIDRKSPAQTMPQTIGESIGNTLLSAAALRVLQGANQRQQAY